MIYLGNAIGSCLNIGYPPFTFAVSATQWRYCPSELFASTQALRASNKSVRKAPFTYGEVLSVHDVPPPIKLELSDLIQLSLVTNRFVL